MLTVASCRKSNEIHDKRHREIAALLGEIIPLSESNSFSSPLSAKKIKTVKSNTFDAMHVGQDFGEGREEENSEHRVDSSTLNDDGLDTHRLRKLDTTEYTGSKKAKKVERKAAKFQDRFKTCTVDDLKRIQEALHPKKRLLLGERISVERPDEAENANNLLNNEIVEADIAFSSRTFEVSSLRAARHAKKFLAKIPNPATPPSNNPLDDPEMTETLRRLGVGTKPVHSCKLFKSLMARLIGAITNDLSSVENEERETMARMTGYWRYVNKKTYNAMVGNNQLCDWTTGVKLDEIEEEGDECIAEPSNSASETVVETPPAMTDAYDEGFQFGLGQKVLEVADRSAEVDIEMNRELHNLQLVDRVVDADFAKGQTTSTAMVAAGINTRTTFEGVRDVRLGGTRVPNPQPTWIPVLTPMPDVPPVLIARFERSDSSTGSTPRDPEPPQPNPWTQQRVEQTENQTPKTIPIAKPSATTILTEEEQADNKAKMTEIPKSLTDKGFRDPEKNPARIFTIPISVSEKGKETFEVTYAQALRRGL